MNAEKVIERIKKIQNKTRNLGWGISEYSPLMNLGAVNRTESQWIVVVGHNVHRKIHTMFLEVFHNGTCSLSVLTKCNTVGEYICDNVLADDLIKVLCETLKVWFPEINAIISKGVMNDA